MLAEESGCSTDTHYMSFFFLKILSNNTDISFIILLLFRSFEGLSLVTALLILNDCKLFKVDFTKKENNKVCLPPHRLVKCIKICCVYLVPT